MGRSFLITGTDTGVGKTFIACGLIKAFKNMNLTVIPFKPAETGCIPYPQDGILLKDISGIDLELEEIVPFIFKEPLAPAVAEEIERKKIDLNFIKEKLEKHKKNYDIVVVEGAGGLLVPVTGKFTYADLAAFLELPLVIVARSKLGTINHTLLTIRIARAQGLKILCVIINGYEGADTAEKTNPEIIKKLGDVPVFVVKKAEDIPELRDIAEFILKTY